MTASRTFDLFILHKFCSIGVHAHSTIYKYPALTHQTETCKVQGIGQMSGLVKVQNIDRFRIGNSGTSHLPLNRSSPAGSSDNACSVFAIINQRNSLLL